VLVTENKDIFNPKIVNFDERQKQLVEEEQKEQERREREKGSPFNRWAQFNLEHSKELMWLAMKHPKAHSVLYFLVDHMDEYNAVMCSYKVLEEVFGASKATITRAIRTLKNCGLIAVLKSGTSNVYAINDKFFWKSWGSNRKYSKFPANIVLTLSEQEEDYQISFSDLKTTKHKEIFKDSENTEQQKLNWSEKLEV
jgi:DNA-binding transcriptional ArsR family regulator